ncbi:MAG: hydrogenase large subunit [archaeon]|nr:hydrogenase large subunit [archaeon]
MITEIHIGISSLAEKIAEKLSEGYGLMCMYANEKGATERSIRTLLRKDSDIITFFTVIEGDSYGAISPAVPQVRPYEREMHEMSGLIPEGLTEKFGPQRLQWAYKDAYPLQKAPLPEERIFHPMPDNRMEGDGVFEIPVGPVHAGIIEPGHFRFSVAGEPILKVRTHFGYTYRGIEKLMEGRSDSDRTRLIERVSGDTAVANALAYAHAMEGDTEVPERARYLRTIFAELERIYCHFGDISGIAQDTGFSVPAVFGAGIKEKILRLNEIVGGHRFLMGTIVPGGVRRDISDDSLKAIQNRILKISFDIEELVGMMEGSSFLMDRVETTGILSHQDALTYRALGPAARASGVKTDVRKELPYDAYGDVGFRVFTRDKGDVYSRMLVKAGEIVESTSIINQCLDRIRPGPLRAEVTPSEGLGLGIVEAPRGELVHSAEIFNGDIWRYRIRDPSFINWLALERALPGNIVADFPLINKSFNLSYSGNDL